MIHIVSIVEKSYLARRALRVEAGWHWSRLACHAALAEMQRTAARRARAALAAVAAASAAEAPALKPHRLSASVIIAAAANALPPGAASSSGSGADYKICLLQRTAKSTFMPDVMVFPGGAVDSEDVSVAEALLGSANDVATVTAVAAAREAFEESGIVVADTPDDAPPVSLSAEACASWRERVHDDASQFVAFLAEQGAKPALEELTPLCSFITPDMEHDRLPKVRTAQRTSYTDILAIR